MCSEGVMILDITRRGFGALGGLTVLLWLGGCGDGSEDGDFVIGANHANGPHSIFISAADLNSANGKSFNIIGQALHNHTVFFSAEDLKNLQAGVRIDAVSSLASDGAEHQHLVTVFAPAQ
jgi:hypothetical protein